MTVQRGGGGGNGAPQMPYTATARHIVTHQGGPHASLTWALWVAEVYTHLAYQAIEAEAATCAGTEDEAVQRQADFFGSLEAARSYTLDISQAVHLLAHSEGQPLPAGTDDLLIALAGFTSNLIPGMGAALGVASGALVVHREGSLLTDSATFAAAPGMEDTCPSS